MEPISKDKIKIIYAIGNALGIVDRGDHDDRLHQLVEALTGKSSVSALSADEAEEVIRSLRDHMKAQNRASDAQKSKIWAIYYQLRSYDDPGVNQAKDGERLAGIVKKVLKLEVSVRYPLANITKQDASKLIKVLSAYITATQKKRSRGDAGGSV